MSELFSQRRDGPVSESSSLETMTSFSPGRLDIQRDIASAFAAHSIPREAQFSALLQMPESEQQKAIALMTPQDRMNLERIMLQRSLSIAIGRRESELLALSDLPNNVLQEVLLHADKAPQSIAPPRGSQSIGKLLEDFDPPTLEKLKAVPDEVLKKALAASTLSEMSRLPSALSNYIFEKFKNDPNEILKFQQIQFANEHLPSTLNIRNGAQRNFEEVGKKLKEAYLPDVMSSENSALRVELQGWRERAAAANGVLSQYRNALESSEAHARVAKLLTIVSAQGDTTIKSKLDSHIVNSLNEASATLFEARRGIDTSIGADKIRQSGIMLSESANNLDVAVQRMIFVRNGAFGVVAAGAATLAAPVVFGAVAAAGVGTALSTVASVGAGAAVGAVVDASLTTVTEVGAAPMHVALGNKTVEEVQRDVVTDVSNAAKRGGIAGLQGGAGAIARVGLLSKLGRPEVLTSAQTLGVAALSSGIGKAAAIPVERIGDYIAARDEFLQRYGALPLSEETRAERFAAFLELKGLTVQGVSQQAIKDILFSAGTASIGAKFQMNRQSISNATLAQNLRSEGAEFVTNVTLGVAKGYLETPEERRNFSNIVNLSIGEAFSAMTGALQGRATGVSAGAANRQLAAGAPRLTSSGAVVPAEINVVTHTSVEAVRQKYIEMALNQVELLKNRNANSEERQVIEEFAGNLHAFWDKNEKRMHIAELDPELPDSLRALREALILHEKSHAEGKDEVEAIEAQAIGLAERGFQMSFEGGDKIVSKLEEGSSAVLPTRAEITEYTERKYSRAEELAPGLAAGSQGAFSKSSRPLLTSSDPIAVMVNKKYRETDPPLVAPPNATAAYYQSKGGDCSEYHSVKYSTEVDGANISERTEVKIPVEVEQYWHIDPSRPEGKQDSWRAAVVIKLTDPKFQNYPAGTRLQVVFPDSNGGRTTVWVTVPPTKQEKVERFELLRKEGESLVVRGRVGDFDLMPNATWDSAKGTHGAKRDETLLGRGHFR